MSIVKTTILVSVKHVHYKFTSGTNNLKKKYHIKRTYTPHKLSQKKSWDFHLRELIDRTHFRHFGGLRSQPSLPRLSPTRDNSGNEFAV